MDAKKIINGLSILVLLAYPLAVYFGLKHFSVSTVAIILCVLLAVRFLFVKKSSLPGLGKYLKLIIGLGIAVNILSWAVSDQIFLKLYPVIINAGMFVLFFQSLIFGPPVIELLARLSEPDLDERGIRYVRRVTEMWAVFFVVNGSASLVTTLYYSDDVWVLYNGLISYLLVGALFSGEWVFRQFYRQRVGSHS